MVHLRIDEAILLSLAREAIKELETAERDGRIRRMLVPYMRKNVEIQAFEKTGFSASTSYSQVQKSEWSDRLVQPFIERDWDFKNSKRFQDAVDLVMSVTSVHRKQAEFWLSCLVEAISRNQLSPEPGSLEDLVSIFVSDLLCASKTYRLKAQLVGIWLTDGPIRVDNIIVRRSESGDFVEEFREGLLPFLPDLSVLMLHHPTAVLEFTTESPNQTCFFKEHQCLVVAMRLFALGSVEILKHSYDTRSLIEFGGSGFKPEIGDVNHTYDMSAGDAAALRRFLKGITDLIPESWYMSSYEQSSEISVAYRRYVDSLFERGPPVKRLSLAVMGLEALFLGGDEAQELKHKLSQRIAKFMSCFGYDRSL